MLYLFFALIFIISCSTKVESKKKYTYSFPKTYKEEKPTRGSLFKSPQSAYLYGSVRASEVGDVIYIRVIESINAIESVSTNVGRSTSFSNAISSFFGVHPATLKNLGAGGKSSFASKGGSKFQQSGVLTTTLAGRVVKVFPNGTMLVEAKKYIEVNGVKREFLLRGIVRPEDIDSNNTVTSDKIADMEIFFEGRGYIVRGGEPGWLAKIFAILFPF
ncbi:flagellar basal body L-ring protein FlgH [Aquifex aeolicus]|uniref:Flagellar L-ring protein n=1 Tax=Aquifex aeolicus (strain VF5) TaxID=224324 RepID=FLGH_AQUAE|nr:flagellar basal body L-ring protein FlgH [Aquifex aeolicus]O67609.1 RecName: Full=Flagellar L-ring protein; AltName: Full=Basal body L-ring protein; Flags: Precursor [Aquifex aeolicus VF5]AAC07570.1 flagellar L-ring protein FlgH [Aquifex aeolicus VF5]